MNTRLFEVWISHGQSKVMFYVLDQPFEYWTNICLVFKRLGCPVFKWHLKTRSFGIQPLCDHSIFGSPFSSQPLENRTIQNPNIFAWIRNGVKQNGYHLSGFQIRSRSKPGPFGNQPLFDHLKSKSSPEL